MSKIEVWVKADEKFPQEPDRVIWRNFDTKMVYTYYYWHKGGVIYFENKSVARTINISAMEWLDESAITALEQDNALKEEWEDNPLTSAVYEGAELWEQEYKDCRDILQALVDLKNSKDVFGKTDKYNELQPIAWARAKEFLKTYEHQ